VEAQIQVRAFETEVCGYLYVLPT